MRKQLGTERNSVFKQYDIKVGLGSLMKLKLCMIGQQGCNSGRN